MNLQTLRIPEYLVTYFMYGDCDALTEKEKFQADEFITDHSLGFLVGVGEESYFSHTNDVNNLMGNVLECVFEVND